jgi:hypothetical protein
VIDNAEARTALAARWGYPLGAGEVRLTRGYDCIDVDVVRGGRSIFAGALQDPMPLRTADAYYVANIHLAHTPNGLRLVQVDPDFDVERAERGRALLLRFEPDAWACEGVRPSDPVSASFTVATVTLPSLRYVCRPDVLAFEGTERVDT